MEKLRVCFLAALLLSPGCKPFNDDSEPLVFQVVKEGWNSAIREPLERGVRSEEEWMTLWAQHAAWTFPEPEERPAVDFNLFAVAAIFAGEFPNSGFRVLIDDVLIEGIDVIVRYHIAYVGGVVPAVTQPYLIIKFSKPAGNIKFVKRRS